MMKYSQYCFVEFNLDFKSTTLELISKYKVEKNENNVIFAANSWVCLVIMTRELTQSWMQMGFTCFFIQWHLEPFPIHP